LFFFASILFAFLFRKSFEFSLTAFVVSALVGALIPGVILLIYAKDPFRRQKESAKPKLMFNICMIAFLTFFMFNLVIALLTPNGKSLNNASIYLPSIYALVLPFFGIIFNVLYRTENYQIGYSREKKD
jgi:integral membrane sensor domain MASE1